MVSNFQTGQPPRPQASSLFRCFLAALACSVALLACDNDVDIFIERDGITYAVEAAFKMGETRHFVRVQPLQDGIPFGTDSTIDAEVTLEDLSTGERIPMTDSLFRFDGVLVHNFYADLELQSGRRYRITARRSDGETTTATARAPEEYPTPKVSQVNKQCLAKISVSIDGAPRLIRANVQYSVDGIVRPISKISTVRRSEGKTTMQFWPECDLEPIVGTVDTTESDSLLIYRCTRLDTGRIPVVVNVVGDDWPVNFSATPEEDVNRAVNVEGGLGFFGISRLDTITTHVDKDAEVDTLINGVFPMKNDQICPVRP